MSASYKHRELEEWAVADVVDFLEDLELSEPIVTAFKDNAVSGSMLAGLTDEELTEELGMRPLQMKKLKGALNKLTPTQLSDVGPGERDTRTPPAIGPATPKAGDADEEPEAADAAAPALASAPAFAPAPDATAAAAAAAGAAATQASSAAMRAYSQAQALLRQADASLAQASGIIGKSLTTQAMQTGAEFAAPRRRDFTVVGMVADTSQKKGLEAAGDLAESAVDNINRARGLAPDMPAIHLPVVKEVRGALAQGLTRGPGMDAFRTGKMSSSKKSIDACRQSVAAAQAFLSGRLNALAAAPHAQPAQQPQPAYPPGPSAQNYAPAGAGADFDGAPAGGYYPPPSGYAAPAPPPSGGGGVGVGGAVVGGMVMGAAARNMRVRREVRQFRR